jgi:hypothetical protein
MIPGQDLSPRYKVFFLLWNKGTAPIEQSDFIAPIKIRPKDKIAAPDLISKDIAASVEFAANDTILLKLLRPGEAVTFSVYFHDQTVPELDVQMKSADMSTIFSRSLQDAFHIAAMPISMIVILFSLLAAGVGIAHYLQLPLPLSGYVSIPALVVIVILTMLGVDRVMKVMERFTTPRSPIVARYVQVATACENARQKWNSLQNIIKDLEKL